MVATKSRKSTKQQPASNKEKIEAQDKFQLVTDKLLALLEKGVKPWVKPWNSANGGAFKNLISGHAYTGINPILCLIDTIELEDQRPYFLSFLQGKELGWKLNKGCKATWLRWGGKGVKEFENAETGELEKKYYNAAKWLSVFHISHFDDSEAEKKISSFTDKLNGGEYVPTEKERLDKAEKLILATNAKIIYGGDRAFYSPSTDSITLPSFEDFKTVHGYYGTAIHELVHWTSHHSRCSRTVSGNFGSSEYAFEELVAEVGAAFVLNGLGLEAELENHASYVSSWSKVLKSDNRAFFNAASLAGKAADYLTALGEQQINKGVE